MCGAKVESICRLAKKMLDLSKRGSGRVKGGRWWNEEVKQKVKVIQEAYNALVVVEKRRKEWSTK